MSSRLTSLLPRLFFPLRAPCRRGLAGLAVLGILVAANPVPPQAAQPESAQPESDSAVLERVERYLSDINTLHAQFLQTSSTGTTAAGELWLARPGKLRFEYDPPVPVLIVANGRFVLYYDKDLEQTSYVPISQTPLWFLLDERVDLSKAENYELAGVERGKGTLRVSVAQNGSAAGKPGSITLVFQDDPLELKKWRLIDQQGVATEVSLLAARDGVAVDGKRFDFGALDLPDQTRPQKGR